MVEAEQAVLWPSAEHYPRFREVCGDTVFDTYDEFVVAASRTVANIEAAGFQARKVDFDPDHMAEWCRANFGKIDPTSRASYVAFLVLSESADGSE